MAIWQKIHNIIVNDEKVRESILLTSTITAFLLREAMNDDSEFQKEAGILNKFLSLLYKCKQIHAAYKGFQIFTPHVQYELLNRYEAIKKELKDIKPDILIIGACGLSPLGLTYALENPDKQVFDTDLPNIIATRQELSSEKPSNYQLSSLDLLDEEAVRAFGRRIKESAATKSLAIVAEGLTFYFDDEQREKLNKNLQILVKEIKPENPEAVFIIDYFTWGCPSKDRDFKPVSINTSLSKIFHKLAKNITSGQKCFMKSIEEVKEYLATQNFINIRHSRYSTKGIAHNVYVCEYGGQTK